MGSEKFSCTHINHESKVLRIGSIIIHQTLLISKRREISFKLVFSNTSSMKRKISLQYNITKKQSHVYILCHNDNKQTTAQ